MRAHLRHEAADEVVCAEHGFLNDIFGVCAAAQQPARTAESNVDMGQYKLFEPQSVVGIPIVQRIP
jgi:hypothetical protein